VETGPLVYTRVVWKLQFLNNFRLNKWFRQALAGLKPEKTARLAGEPAEVQQVPAACLLKAVNKQFSPAVSLKHTTLPEE
jgi:hypothetical protein